MKNYITKIFLTCATVLVGMNVQAQCPQITCPTNVTVNNDPGNCSAVVNYTAPVGIDPCSTGSSTFNFTGGMQTFTVPVGVTSVTITALGSQGGSNAGGVVGGQGGQATGTLAVTPGDVLNVYVGGTNGFNGGGTNPAHPCAAARGGNGGGASDVRLNSTALAQRVIVAGGGGGAGGQRVNGCGRGSGGGGGGGYFGGGGGASWPFASTTLPGGGTQVAGGNGGTTTYGPGNNGTAGGLGIGGNGGNEISSSQGGSAGALAGGVGGGLTGAIGQYGNNWTGQSGAGGSSYITGLTSSSTTSGGRTGNGQVVISYAGAAVTTTQTAGLPSGSTFPLGTTTNTFSATNVFGTVTCSFTVTVVDAENPVTTCPGPVTLNTTVGQCTATGVIGTATATDNCTLSPVITNNAPGTFPIGNTTVVWTSTDGAGNTDTCQQIVTVVDAENPVVTCPADVTINTDAGICTSTGAIGTATGTDNCGVPTITSNAPASFPIGNTTVIWTATDGAGNIDTCHQIVTVVDAENPVVTCPVDVTINTDAGQCTSTGAIGTAAGTDNCGVPTITSNAPVSFPIGNTTVIWTATDGSGNIDTCHQIVTVVDTENPVVTCPIDTTINTDAGQCTSTAAIGIATATDNCTSLPVITNNAPVSFPIGTTTVIWTATDSSGNIDTCHQIVTVVDAELPVITCPANITMNNDSGMCDAIVTYVAPVGTDNCVGAVTTLTSGLASGSTFPVGTTTVTYTVTDGSSNVDSCSFTVTVVDAELPLITCPGNITVGNDPNVCSAVVTYVAPVGTDNCPGVVTTLTSGLASGSTFPVGTTTVTYTVTDAASNVDSCSFTVTVADSVAPVALCKDFTLYLDAFGTATLIADSIDGGSTDDCAIDTLTLSQDVFTCSNLDSNSVTLYVTDTYGNVDSCTATVTVLDTVAPSVLCKDITLYLDGSGNVTLIPDSIDGGSTDNCSIDSLSVSQTVFTCVEMGVNNVMLYVVDSSGNMDSCTAIVTVLDTIPPSIICPSDQNVETDVTCMYEIGDYTSLATSVIDNCDMNNVIITQDPAAGTMVTADNISNSSGQTIVTIIVQDMSGNIDSCDFVIDVDCSDELEIPNVFTPNGDGTNDVWNLNGIDEYPDAIVQVFNRWGDIVFESTVGYTEAWDGTYNGTDVPVATYYYIIKLSSSEEGISGTINIVR